MFLCQNYNICNCKCDHKTPHKMITGCNGSCNHYHNNSICSEKAFIKCQRKLKLEKLSDAKNNCTLPKL